MKRLLLILPFLLIIASPGFAASAPGLMQQYAKGEPVVLKSDTAYVLYRADPRATQRNRLARFSFEFVFTPVEALSGATPGETKRSDPKAVNVFRPFISKAYDSTPDAQTVLISVPPGRYVLAGLTMRDVGVMGTCLCMGTVSFDAKPGVITDLGYLIGEFDGLTPAAPEFQATPYYWTEWGDMWPVVMAAAVRPATAEMPVPAGLKGLMIVPADYRAFGKFPNYFAGAINRLTPIKGVLDYDADRIVDLKAGR